MNDDNDDDGDGDDVDDDDEYSSRHEFKFFEALAGLCSHSCF